MRRNVVFLALGLQLVASGLMAQADSTTIKFALTHNNPDGQVRIEQVLEEFSASGSYGVTASGASTRFIGFAPGSFVIDNGQYELRVVGTDGFPVATGVFYVQASGGTQTWQIDTKPRVLRNTLLWGGLAATLLGALVAVIELGPDSSSGDFSGMALPAVAMGGGLVVELSALAVPSARVRQID